MNAISREEVEPALAELRRIKARLEEVFAHVPVITDEDMERSRRAAEAMR